MLWLAGSPVPVCQAFLEFALAAVGLFDSFSPSEVCVVASGRVFAAEFGIHRILVTPPLCRRHGGEYRVGTTTVL